MVLRLLLAAALVAGLASAQRGGGGGSKGGNSGGDMGMRPQRQTRMDMIAEKLKLSKEQKDEVSKVFDNAQEKATPLNEQIVNGRKAMAGMLIAGKNSGEEWDKLMTEFTSVLVQQEAIETEAFQKVYASLEDKQKKSAPQVFEELMAGMFAGRDWKRAPMSGGGRGGGMSGPMSDSMGDGMSRGGR